MISEQIDKYRIGWVKFDFNASIPVDPSGDGFYHYLAGQRRFIERLREKYPDLYLTNCASGGYRMELGQGMLFDSFWLSDNQGPYEGIRIVKDTLKRLPTGLIERWNVQKHCDSIPSYHLAKTGRMIHCNDATWKHLIGVQDSFSEGFLHGGPMGFSCDLADFPDTYKQRWSEVIAQYKTDRNFYKNATARILVDSDPITVIQYADETLDECVLQIYTKTVYAAELCLYPVVKRQARYRCGDTLFEGAELLENGLPVDSLKDNSCLTLKLIAEK